MSIVVIALAVLILVAITVLLVKLQSWRPLRGRPGRNCPECGGRRTTTVELPGRLHGMLECRACHRVWQPPTS
ncbi:hypothetical protein [Streptomyces albipurpureus]|uniref:Uncharacterized protein n=1 Tax=Streptomyces albipurpureus TaxID=2897419 RepID=A0ABT0UZ61_9ACTN|nr:hypothetical protein [Streptomyces sp. CWNU-1]MCM2393862.1 hypothetical protein [Streptomyces sp. CWNU-1]